MTIDDSVNKLLEGGGKSLSWNGTPPITHIITVDSAKTQQSTEMGTGKPRFFDSGDPIMDIVVSGYVDQRDGPDDDGLRRLFLKNDAIRALKEALRTAGAQIGRGGRLAVQYHGDEQTKTGTKKLFKAQYAPPSPTAAANDLLGAPAPTPAAALPNDFPAAAPAPAKVDPFGDDFLDR